MTDELEREKWLNLKQQVLPFDFWEEEKEAETSRLQKQADRLPRFKNPTTDNERLLNLQWRYRHGDEKALNEMYKISMQICLKFINTIGKNNRHVRSLTKDEKQIKASDSASYLIEQYMTRADFAAEKSIPGYLYLRVLHELFYRREVDKIVDFVDLNAFYKEGENDKEVEE